MTPSFDSKPSISTSKRVQRLLALVVSAAQACATMAADGVDFIDEDDAGRVLLALFEQVANAARADADEHLDEVGTGNGEERHVGFAGDGAREQSLAGSRRPDEQHALGNAAAELLELLRIFQEVDDFLQLFLGLVDSGDVLERGLLLLRGQQARAGLAEAQGLVSAGLHLAHHENPDAERISEGQRVESDAHPVAVGDFAIVVEHALILQGLGDVGNGGVGDGHAAELGVVAILALKLGAIGREIDVTSLTLPLSLWRGNWCSWADLREPWGRRWRPSSTKPPPGRSSTAKTKLFVRLNSLLTSPS